MLSSWILLKSRTSVQFRGAFKLHHTDCCTQPERRPTWITCCCDNIYLSSIHQKVHSCCTCTQSQCIKTTIGSWLYRVHSVPFVQTAMTASWGFLLIVGWFLILSFYFVTDKIEYFFHFPHLEQVLGTGFCWRKLWAERRVQVRRNWNLIFVADKITNIKWVGIHTWYLLQTK